jgi:endogenous inhibitor of DNA gyrase (YacG/DUF329 family)
MTELQKEQIGKLRNMGLGYAGIAKKMGLTKDQVSSYCRRKGLTGFKSNGKNEYDGDFCRNCGKTLTHTPGKKKRKFCSTECRLAWWNANPEKMNRKAMYSYTCPVCGSAFSAYGNAHRIYCSRECSRFARYGHV